MGRVYGDDLQMVVANFDIDVSHGFDMPPKAISDFYEMPVKKIGLSKSLDEALRGHKINTVGNFFELIDFIEERGGCGNTTATEIKNMCFQTWYEGLSDEESLTFWEEFIDMNRKEGEDIGSGQKENR